MFNPRKTTRKTLRRYSSSIAITRHPIIKSLTLSRNVNYKIIFLTLPFLSDFISHFRVHVRKLKYMWIRTHLHVET